MPSKGSDPLRSGNPIWQRRMATLLQGEPSRAEHEQTRQDNAVAESFFSSLKKERIKKRIYANRDVAILDIADYIDPFYHSKRRHSHLGGICPDEFEAIHRRRR